MSISDHLRVVARKHSDKVAIIGGDRVLTYGDLDRTAMELARWFLGEGAAPGDRVAIHGTNTIETVISLLGCFHAGLVAVPVNTRFKLPEIQYVLSHSRPRFLFSEPKLSLDINAVQSTNPGLSQVYTALPLTRPGPDAAIPSADAPALILYTSGTTARPKGVTHTLRTLMASVATVQPAGFEESSSVAMVMPLMHAAGLCGLLLPSLASGATVVLSPAFEPGGLLDLIERHHCTLAMGLPTMMQFVALEQERRPRTLSSMRAWLAGGDSVPLSLQQQWERVFGMSLIEGYAMSESCVISYNRASAVRPGSIGVPAPGVELRVLNLDGTCVTEAAVGELAVRSAANTIGYWDDPETTARMLVDGWLLTGDLGRRDCDGYFWFEGRKKELIIRGGSNISPQEVEEALSQHPSVKEAGVVGVPDEVYGEQVMAVVALCEGSSVAESDLKEFARQRLADYKVPARIAFVSELPRGITGKVQRRALKDLAFLAT